MAKLWGSRFKKGTDKLADKFSFSIDYDYRLAIYDVKGSIAHARMLGKCKIISKTDTSKIVGGLNKLVKRIESDRFKFDAKSEDIHTNIQQELKKLIGQAADKLHTARSRNDLIVLDMKMFCLDEFKQIEKLIINLQKSVLKCAKKNKHVIVPAYTHLQSAQVVLLAHQLLAYIEMLERDKTRIQDYLKRIDTMPLGSCALSGTTLPIDRMYVAKQLKFSQVTQNSIDSVSDRDFIIEGLAALAILGTHFSRVSEDFIIWATNEFGYVDIDWSLCTGSSIMPHKKNPDILELTRGETAKLISNLNEILILMKGLPLTYNRDLQLDKPPLFESVEKVKDMTQLLTKFFDTIQFDEAIIDFDVTDEAFFSVDIMEYLIRKGVSYRDAHDTVGEIFKECSDKGKSIIEMSKEQLKKYSPKFEEDVKQLLDPNASVRNKKSLGSTNPVRVQRQIKRWQQRLTR